MQNFTPSTKDAKSSATNGSSSMKISSTKLLPQQLTQPIAPPRKTTRTRPLSPQT
ncbi:hypothetical protein [Rubritalea tangerina]|uniref:hypothetical protein n=1 Tax=Rubritalea tangerina TaxID=430798 RepID=UPI00360BCE3B